MHHISPYTIVMHIIHYIQYSSHTTHFLYILYTYAIIYIYYIHISYTPISYTYHIYLIYLLYTPHPYTIDVSLGRLSSSDDCAIFIATKNNVGDPVIRTVQAICEMYTNLTAIFLNCDLSDRVTSGEDKGQNYEGYMYPCVCIL